VQVGHTLYIAFSQVSFEFWALTFPSICQTRDLDPASSARQVPHQLPLLSAPNQLQRAVGDGVHGGGHQRRAVPRHLSPTQPQAKAGKVHRLRAIPLLHPGTSQMVRVQSQESY
jgi:hypothetical protein